MLFYRNKRVIPSEYVHCSIRKSALLVRKVCIARSDAEIGLARPDEQNEQIQILILLLLP